MTTPFDFLEMDFDRIHRASQEELVTAFKDNDATWESAFKAASFYSSGRACIKGNGGGGESARFHREPQRDGSFNICYWIKVAGEEREWVVRFPKPYAPLAILQTKVRSEAATLQYLRRHTQVPVPRLIGYSDGIPPFLIIEHVEGWRLNIIWGRRDAGLVQNAILKSLAKIQHELLSHPFDKIGMLEKSDSDEIIGPLSIDALEHCRDGVIPNLPSPFETASEYYEHKLEVAVRRLRIQRNSIASIPDGQRRFLVPHVVREYMRREGNSKNDAGPFYLVHPDLHGSNVIIDTATFTIASILDWEGACIVPIEDACALPRCLHNHLVDDLLPNSEKWQTFNHRAKTYAKFFSDIARSHQTEFAVSESITTKLFFTWAIADVRFIDPLIWQHIAPFTYPELRRDYDRIYAQNDYEHTSFDELEDFISSVINKFVENQVKVNLLRSELDQDVGKKMKDLKEYLKELEGSRKTE